MHGIYRDWLGFRGEMENAHGNDYGIVGYMLGYYRGTPITENVTEENMETAQKLSLHPKCGRIRLPGS